MIKKTTVAFLVSLALPVAIFAQSCLYSSVKGNWEPVIEIIGKTPVCMSESDIENGTAQHMAILPAESFGAGFVKVEVLQNHRDGVIESNGVLRFTSDRNWYSLKCRLTSDRDIQNCHYSLVFDTYGKKNYHCRSIGFLEAGKPKLVRVYMKVGYELPDRFHVFSGMEELRTSLIPDTYSEDSGNLLFADGSRHVMAMR